MNERRIVRRLRKRITGSRRGKLAAAASFDVDAHLRTIAREVTRANTGAPTQLQTEIDRVNGSADPEWLHERVGIDREGTKLLAVSPTAAAQLGHAPQALIDHSLDELQVENIGERRRRLDRDGHQNGTMRLKRADGELVLVRYRIERLVFDGREVFRSRTRLLGLLVVALLIAATLDVFVADLQVDDVLFDWAEPWERAA